MACSRRVCETLIWTKNAFYIISFTKNENKKVLLVFCRFMILYNCSIIVQFPFPNWLMYKISLENRVVCSVQCSNTCKKYVYYSGFVFLYERRESNGNYQPELATVYNYIINHNNDQTTINRIWYYCMFLVPYRFHQMGL